MSKEQIWIEAGYKSFAIEGAQNVRIEKLARAVNRNKSSFYHFFADLEVFTARLLEEHLSQAKILSKKEAEAQNEAELVDILLDHKIDLLFNRQLRIHRENEVFQDCFAKTNEISIPGFVPIWRKIIGLPENAQLAELVLIFSMENFFLQITEETLNKVWLSNYFKNIKSMVEQFQSTGTVAALNANV
jgi:AcrR family transcriptional regulator